jgi:HEAT repeat protein
MKHLIFCLVVASVGPLGLAIPADKESDLAGDEKTLQDAQIKTDSACLLDFFRRHTVPEKDRDPKVMADLIRKLGDDSFEAREAATEGLRRLGKYAVPMLTVAARDSDPEVARRAEECLSAAQKRANVGLFLAAANLLAQRKPAGAASVLLAFLPDSPDDQVTEAVFVCLRAVSKSGGQLDPSLPAALGDREPSRRSAAAYVVARAAPEHWPVVRRLLDDPEVEVRYHAARALVRAGDKTVMEALLARFGDCPPHRLWQVEDLLFSLAGEKGPAVSLSAGLDPANRLKCREAWEKWWAANRDTVDLSILQDESVEVGAKVICELQGGKDGGGRIFELGPDDKVRWQFDNVAGPIDVQLLPSGRVLLAEINVNRVTERDRQGKVLFTRNLEHSPMTAQGLANGNVFIATYHELLEVTPAGQTVYSYRKPEHRIYCAQKLRNGHILYVSATGLLVELDREGRQVRTVPAGDTSNWGSVELLPNGHFLVCRCGQHEVVEIDTDGKTLWRGRAEWPTWACHRANGHVLVACAHSGQVLEFDRTGKEVWKQKLTGRPCRVRRY